MEVQAGGILDVEGFIEFPLPLFLQHIEGVNDIGVWSGAVEVGDVNLGVTQVGADFDPSDGDEFSIERTFPGDEAGEDGSDGFGDAEEATTRHIVILAELFFEERERGSYRVWGTFSSW